MSHLTRRSTLSAFLASAVAGPIAAAQPARLTDRRWSGFGQSDGPDHAEWDAILDRHLRLGRDGIARFDYEGADRMAVRRYLERLTTVDPATLTANAAFAYWVNLYNALTVDVVAGAWPVRSIRDIGGNLLAPGPWRQPLVTVSGRRLSLDDIEHGILRPVWRDPRVHYAVNCASLGCPNLAPRAYTADRLDAMLNEAAESFVNHTRGVRFRSGKLEVSSIFRWYGSDFGGTDDAVIEHLRKHASPELGLQLAEVTRIASDSYDWRINA